MNKIRIFFKEKPIELFLLALALLKIILPFFLQNSLYQPHRDEFLYLAEGNHPDWGYLEIPPLLNVFAWITVHLGKSMFWIKIWPAIFSGFSFWICGIMAIRLGGKYFSILLVWFAFVFGSYIRLFYLFQPNFLEVFFWISIAFGLFKYIDTHKNIWLYVWGISLGLGLLSKYSIAFYFIGLLIGLVLSQERKVFLNKHFYFSLLLAFLIFLPNLIWEYGHNFPFLHHMRQLQQEQLQYLNTADFIKNQFLMNIASILVWVLGLIYLGFHSKTKPFRLFFWAYLFTIFILIALKGKDYYALGSYPVLLVFGACFIENRSSGKWIWTRYILSLQILWIGILVLPILMPVFSPQKLADYYSKRGLSQSGFCRWEDGLDHPLPQDFADMLGWKEISEKAEKVYSNLSDADKKSTIFFCDDYCTAGALNYYGKGLHIPEAYSDVSNFLLWIPDNLTFRNIILVRHSGIKKKDDINNMFERVRVMDSLNYPLARENEMKILLLENVQAKFLNYLRQRIQTKKALFRRL